MGFFSATPVFQGCFKSTGVFQVFQGGVTRALQNAYFASFHYLECSQGSRNPRRFQEEEEDQE